MRNNTATSKDNPNLNLLPQSMNVYPKGAYNCFPAFTPSNGTIKSGFDNLAREIIDKMKNGLRVLMIDGYHGVDWNYFYNELNKSLINNGINAEWISMNDCIADEKTIYNSIKPFLGGDDRIFGSHFPLGPEVFFDYKKLSDKRIEAAVRRGTEAKLLTIFYGLGAGLLELWDELFYIDIPKDVIQNKFREGNLKNIGITHNVEFEEFYKRSYFVEWPALSRCKQRLLPLIDCFIDGSSFETLTFMNGLDIRSALHEISESPFRVRPWFFPGPWGGKFMQGHMALNPDEPNYAWSFELIVPENGICFEKGGNRLECTFDMLMFQENERTLGEEESKQFKYEWPIRLDYLDTIDGGNLSTQVHPRQNYIQKEFGETYTQDETYYVTVAKPDAKVFIGLTEDCDPEEFHKVFVESRLKSKEVDIEKYVNCELSKPHDLFLIPNGTVHCSGKGNLVLEISATPYIFTFKIYDYLRRDLEGNLRPINIERGFDNIRFERRKNWVKENLIAKPVLITKGSDWKEESLYDKPYTFYNINRVEFEREYEFDTKDKSYTINLVEGERITLESQNGRVANLSFLETMIIPAATGKVKFINKSNGPCKFVKVYVKEGIGKTVPLNDPLK
ncbi:MAG: class I mannose-6-phosphate isomerase [Ignavibacteriaceae bacterium]